MKSSNSTCLVIAGEKSGEEHLSSFFIDLKKRLPATRFFGVGGDYLRDQQVELLYHLKDFSNMGFTDVFGKLNFYRLAMKNILQEVDNRNCQYAILVDFQTFNIQLLKKLKARGLKVFYYVAPQAWAWKSWRAKTLAKNVHTLFTILPFEKDWFHARGVKRVVSVVHPAYLNWQEALLKLPKKTLPKSKVHLLILPGSREMEIKNLLPIFKNVLEKITLMTKSVYQFEISLVKTHNISENIYQPILELIDHQYGSDQLGHALSKADLAIAASGTVTLTCGLFQVPTVVCYKVSLLNEFIARTLVSYDGPISLTNIILQHRIFPELIQDEVEPNRIIYELLKFLKSKDLYHNTLDQLAQLPALLRGDNINIANYLADHLSTNQVEPIDD